MRPSPSSGPTEVGGDRVPVRYRLSRYPCTASAKGHATRGVAPASHCSHGSVSRPRVRLTGFRPRDVALSPSPCSRISREDPKLLRKSMRRVAARVYFRLGPPAFRAAGRARLGIRAGLNRRTQNAGTCRALELTPSLCDLGLWGPTVRFGAIQRCRGRVPTLLAARRVSPRRYTTDRSLSAVLRDTAATSSGHRRSGDPAVRTHGGMFADSRSFNSRLVESLLEQGGHRCPDVISRRNGRSRTWIRNRSRRFATS